MSSPQVPQGWTPCPVCGSAGDEERDTGLPPYQHLADADPPRWESVCHTCQTPQTIEG